MFPVSTLKLNVSELADIMISSFSFRMKIKQMIEHANILFTIKLTMAFKVNLIKLIAS